MKGLPVEAIAAIAGVSPRHIECELATLGMRPDGETFPPEAFTAYHGQRVQAGRRDIAWEFTFETWWKVWTESGKWAQRGRHRDEYVMSRHGDRGPYAPGNVRICTSQENLAESRCLRGLAS